MPTTRNATHENPLLWHLLPWFFWLPNHAKLSEWSKRTTQAAVEPINKTWQEPLYVLAGGARKFDISPCGAQDMILNALELVCPQPEAFEKRLETCPYMQVAFLAHDRRGPALARL